MLIPSPIILCELIRTLKPCSGHAGVYIKLVPIQTWQCVHAFKTIPLLPDSTVSALTIQCLLVSPLQQMYKLCYYINCQYQASSVHSDTAKMFYRHVQKIFGYRLPEQKRNQPSVIFVKMISLCYSANHSRKQCILGYLILPPFPHHLPELIHGITCSNQDKIFTNSFYNELDQLLLM